MSTRIPQVIRTAVLQRDEFLCQRCGRSIWGIRYSLQHRRPKKMGGSRLLDTVVNLVTLCGSATDPWGCHSHVEAQREESTALGWLVPFGVTPEEWPVRHFERWEQPGDIWVPAKPHERQIELGAAA